MLNCFKMGANGSIESENIPFNEHFYGFVNFGNTCYVNSVLQALYFCKPFREKLIQYKLDQKSLKHNEENLLNCLAELFNSISNMKKKKGIMQPKKFIQRLKKDNCAFDNLSQQDAHEFLNYLLNTCGDILKAEIKEDRLLANVNKKEILDNMNNQSNPRKNLNGMSVHFNTLPIVNNGNKSKPKATQETNGDNYTFKNGNSFTSNSNRSSNRSIQNNNLSASSSIENQAVHQKNDNTCNNEDTWIHELFQGILVNETKCLNCESVSSKDENFLDLSVDVEQNTSISHCLQEFSSMEMLCGECKYYCDNCSSKQEAEKRMRIKKLPRVLALHLKRFKFMSNLNKYIKLTYRVVFPFELRLFNTTEDCSNGDRVYDLVSFVVHCGMGLNRGHYISVVKSHGYWFVFDDEQVERIEISTFEDFYGLTQDTNKKSETSYILFYESRE